MIVVAKILKTIAPGTLSLSRPIIKIKVRRANNTGADFKSPKPTKVAGLSTTIPAFFKPIIAKNNPIPAPIQNFNDLGMALIRYALNGEMLIIKNKIPEHKTAANACCHVKPIPNTTA